jgi:cation transport ATPase
LSYRANSTVYSIDQREEQVMNSIRFTIEGLQENETQDRVRNQLEGMIGVQKVYLSAGQDYVDINYNDQTSAAEINNHLQNNGYKVTDLNEAF